MTARPEWNLCVAQRIGAEGKKRAFTQVGVGWDTRSGEGVNLKFNVRLILGPEDELYLFPNKKAAARAHQAGEDDVTEPDLQDDPF